MNIAFSVRLPVDAQSVPLVRGLLRQALEHLGGAASGIDDILLALTEACANVVQLAGDKTGHSYRGVFLPVPRFCGSVHLDLASSPVRQGPSSPKR